MLFLPYRPIVASLPWWLRLKNERPSWPRRWVITPAPTPAAHPAVLDGEWAINCPLARLQVLAVVPG